MELAEPLRPVLALLQRAYPGGVPRQDYWALLVVLGDLMSERNLAAVVAEFIDGETVVVANDAAAADSIRRPARHDVTRVRAVLDAHGLADLYEQEAVVPEFGVFELALRQPGPRDQNLAAMIKANLVAGQSRTDALAELTRFREQLASAGRAEDEDIVLEVMDYLIGWASPHLRL
jgi:hypothetical protein